MEVFGRFTPGVALVAMDVFDCYIVTLWGALNAGLRRVVWLAAHDRCVMVVNDCGAIETHRRVQY